jgi:hypothetical protein
MSWDSNSVVEFVLSMCEALGSISSTNKDCKDRDKSQKN